MWGVLTVVLVAGQDYLATAVAKLPELTCLSLAGASLLSDSILCVIAESLPNLRELLLTETDGFTDAGIYALENCTQLRQLALHPVRSVTAAGLMVLCDYCDQLEQLLLGECPAATEDVCSRPLALFAVLALAVAR